MYRSRVHPQRCSGEAGGPKLPIGKIMPRGLENAVSISQPKPNSPVLDRGIVRGEHGSSAFVSLRWLLGSYWLLDLSRLYGRAAGVSSSPPASIVVSGNLLGRPARRSSSACAKRPTSCAVENTPAWPATPPMRRAVGSCTVPRSRSEIGILAGVGLLSSSMAVGAMRGNRLVLQVACRTGSAPPRGSPCDGGASDHMRATCFGRRKVAGFAMPSGAKIFP